MDVKEKREQYYVYDRIKETTGSMKCKNKKKKRNEKQLCKANESDRNTKVLQGNRKSTGGSVFF